MGKLHIERFLSRFDISRETSPERWNPSEPKGFAQDSFRKQGFWGFKCFSNLGSNIQSCLHEIAYRLQTTGPNVTAQIVLKNDIYYFNIDEGASSE